VFHQHEIVKCSVCDKVIQQCRCAFAGKPVTYLVCTNCQRDQGIRIGGYDAVPGSTSVDTSQF